MNRRLPSDIQIVLCPEGGFAASALSVGAFSEGETPDEAYQNLLDAIRELTPNARTRVAMNETQRIGSHAASHTRITKPPQLTDEEWAVVEGRSTSKSLEGEDAQKWLRGEYVPAHRWRVRA